MPPKCAHCLRNMYTLETFDEIDTDEYLLGYSGMVAAIDRQAFDADWAWQSEWIPALCRECDTEHDHWESPGIWYRLMRWWRNR